MSIVTLNFPGVMFGNVVCHGNFHSYDDVDDKCPVSKFKFHVGP